MADTQKVYYIVKYIKIPIFITPKKHRAQQVNTCRYILYGIWYIVKSERINNHARSILPQRARLCFKLLFKDIGWQGKSKIFKKKKVKNRKISQFFFQLTETVFSSSTIYSNCFPSISSFSFLQCISPIRNYPRFNILSMTVFCVLFSILFHLYGSQH